MTQIRTHVGAKGQIVIPKPVRDELGLRPGDVAVVYTHGGHAHIEKGKPPSSWDEILAVPKKRLPKNIDFDAMFEESYEE